MSDGIGAKITSSRDLTVLIRQQLSDEKHITENDCRFVYLTEKKITQKISKTKQHKIDILHSTYPEIQSQFPCLLQKI